MLLTERSSPGDDDVMSDASLQFSSRSASRVHWFYRVHELDAVAPSERTRVLRDALAHADQGWPLAGAVAIGLLCAFSVSMLLQSQHWSSGLMAGAAGGAFGLAFLLARRDNMRRMLRQRRPARGG